ncbi:MAG: hypothetical protein KDB53_14780, partial [Planctomycetes bacterium]|nr:hypothetical protein [Planctomycetota bacterium]
RLASERHLDYNGGMSCDGDIGGVGEVGPDELVDWAQVSQFSESELREQLLAAYIAQKRLKIELELVRDENSRLRTELDARRRA